MTPNNPNDLPTLPIWTQREIAERYNSEQELIKITLWSTDPARHPARTPRAVHMARTTWRWFCNFSAALSAALCVLYLVLLVSNSLTPLADLARALASGILFALSFGWRSETPAWYIRSLAEMDGDDRHV